MRYAADTDRRALDAELVTLAQAEGRIIVTEDFDFGELLVRQRLAAPGAIMLFLPKSSPEERAARLVRVLATEGFDAVGRLSIISKRRVRQRLLAAM